MSGPGGEDAVANLEAALLIGHGHRVERLQVSNSELRGSGWLKLLATGAASVWSRRGCRAVREAIAMHRPDLIHFHNTFPLLSPAAFRTAHELGVPVVATLHNYRFTCANAELIREGRPCELCIGASGLAGVRYRCYEGSLGRSASVVAINLAHRKLGTFRDHVDAYIVLTGFAKGIMTRAGFPAGRLYVKPNFIPAPEAVPAERQPRVLFVGQMRPAKGLDLLLQAWMALKPQGYTMDIVGEGPERARLEPLYRDDSVVWHGKRTHSEVLALMRRSRLLVLPSRWYEGLPMVVVEALANGTPVAVPGHAAFPEIITDRVNGFLFAPGDVQSLRERIQEALAAGDDRWRSWSIAAQEKFQSDFSPEENYVRLMEIYRAAIFRHKAMGR